MLKKRLIGVVTIKNGWVVQSRSYSQYLPLGKPECLVENLDRWGADEILVQVIDRSIDNAGPDFDLINRLARLGLGTPLVYGGGIRTVEDGIRVIQCGADRLILDAVLHDNLSVVRELAVRLGSQAIIASIPMMVGADGLEWLEYRDKTVGTISDELEALIKNRMISEVLVIDWKHEGQAQGFDVRLVSDFALKYVDLIAFGGISTPDQMTELLHHPQVSAVAVGNFLSYREHAIQKYRDALTAMPFRGSSYAKEVTLVPNG
jgi:imidazole glycerol-phosphate synthase subunit HisF